MSELFANLFTTADSDFLKVLEDGKPARVDKFLPDVFFSRQRTPAGRGMVRFENTGDHARIRP